MSFTDILIIYLAFGAPLMVYQYLRTREASTHRRIFISLLTLLWWIPLAVRLGYGYFTNAYSEMVFVSRRNLDAVDRNIGEIRELMRSELIRPGANHPANDLFETVERYVGLSLAKLDAHAQKRRRSIDHFIQPGVDRELASRCLERREKRRLERHHIRVQLDLVNLFGKLLGNYSNAALALRSVIKIAQQLGDHETAELLEAVDVNSGRLWKPEQQSLPDRAPSPIATIAVEPSRLSID